MTEKGITQSKLLQIELFVFLNWLSLGFFAVLIAFLDLGSLSQIALRFGLFANIPIAVCYGMFVLKYQPPLGKRLFLVTQTAEEKTLVQELPH
jgi:hypothetical protein